MEKIFIKNWKINYYWEWKEIEVTQEEKNILELWWEWKKGKVFPKVEEVKEKTLEEKIQEVKLQTREKILARYSESDQANLTRESQRIIWEIVIFQRKPTEEEMKVLSAAKEADEFIKNCLLECDNQIKELW